MGKFGNAFKRTLRHAVGITDSGKFNPFDTHIKNQNSLSLYHNYQREGHKEDSQLLQDQLTAAANEQRTQEDSIADIDALFGHSSDPLFASLPPIDRNGASEVASGQPIADPKRLRRMQAAQANAKGIEEGYGRQRKAFLDYFTPQLDQQFGGQNQRDTFAAAEAGNLRGSAAALKRQRTFGTFLGAQRQLGSRADTQVDDLRSADQARRLQLGASIRNGTSFQDAAIQGLQDQRFGLASAQNRIAGETLGQVFTGAGDVVSQDAEARGRGRRGFSLFGGGAGASGSITG